MLVKSDVKSDQLEKDKLYVVYSFEQIKNSKYYYIVDDDEFYWPYQVSSLFFKIMDTRISRYWECFDDVTDVISLDKTDQRDLIISFKEWVEDPHFYYKLIEGESVPGLFTDQEAKKAIETFQKYKALMDLEFALPHITDEAIDLGSDNWLICPTCDESWQDKNASVHEMVKCPKCVTTWLSPVNEKQHIRTSL